MNFFVSSFKLQINEEVAKFLSFNIEASIYQLHNAERDPKAYLAKAKTLAFNLKKNEVRVRLGLCVFLRLYSFVLHGDCVLLISTDAVYISNV